MTRNDKNRWAVSLSGLSWPVLIGMAACSAFYVAVFQGPLKTPFVVRYFASHPVLYFETGMFFVGLAALALKFGNLVVQSRAMSRLRFAATTEGDTSSVVQQLLDQLQQFPQTLRRTYLGERLHNAWRIVQRKQSMEGMDDELKYLADLDAGRQQEGYGLVRIVAWATPMLGFLGTVIGITKALGDLDPKLFATDMTTAMQRLLAGLYVAFDTTALALVLSMVLMFLLFFADRIESQLLAWVDERVTEEVLERFRESSGSTNTYLRAVERMSTAVIKTTETLLRQQTERWREAIDETEKQLAGAAQGVGEQISTVLGASLENSLKNHAERLARLEYEADQQMRARWDQWHTALSENVRVVRDQQGEVAKQTEILAQISGTNAEVNRLEQSLNQNLKALMDTRSFEDTVLSLSSAIHLLTARLSGLPDQTRTIEHRAGAQGRAA